MTATAILAALATAVVGVHAEHSHTPGAEALQADSILLAEALDGQNLRMSLRGTSTQVTASAAPAEAFCAAQISVREADTGRSVSRLLRWGDLAWVGPTRSGRTLMAFYEAEGRLPLDLVSFAPTDARGVRAALGRMAVRCHDGEGAADTMPKRVLVSAGPNSRLCYFAGVPGLALADSPAGAVVADPPRAVLSVLSEETPRAELEILFERLGDGDPASGSEVTPTVAFTIADQAVMQSGITDVRFALDGKPIETSHGIAAYGETRLRISMDPFGKSGRRGQREFYRRLSASREVTLSLFDGNGALRAIVHYNSGPVLAASRAALAGDTAWSCEHAAVPPSPAADWRPAP